jgi:hypothetical protein
VVSTVFTSIPSAPSDGVVINRLATIEALTHMQQVHRIHPQDLTKVNVATETALLLSVVVIFGLMFVLLHALS